MRQRRCYSAGRPCVICVLVGASQAREHSDLGPFGQGRTHIYIYIYIHVYMYLITFKRCFLVNGAAQPVENFWFPMHASSSAAAPCVDSYILLFTRHGAILQEER